MIRSPNQGQGARHLASIPSRPAPLNLSLVCTESKDVTQQSTKAVANTHHLLAYLECRLSDICYCMGDLPELCHDGPLWVSVVRESQTINTCTILHPVLSAAVT